MSSIIEESLKRIHKHSVDLSKEVIKKNNEILRKVQADLVKEFKKNPLFNKIHSCTIYGGSYYGGLRVAYPNEYDLNLLISLPLFAEPVIHNSEENDGCVTIELTKYEKFLTQPYADVTSSDINPYIDL